ncbi:MAG: cell division protein FtsW [Clostridiales bacterium 43-6]|nr:MAG: cell division protein FtsW [Clostridiales bacterium 43-6]
MENTQKAAVRKLKLVQRGKMDITFFTLVIVILTIGLVMLFSASSYSAYAYKNNSYFFITKQAGFAVFGVVAMYIISRIDYHILRRFAIALYVISVGLLVTVLVLPPMYEGYQFKRWITEPINFQPSEIAKFAVILLFAHFISLNYKKMEKFTYGILFFGGLLIVVCGLVVVEPHLSATILIFCIGITLMVVGGIKMRWVAGGVIGGTALAAMVILTGIVNYGGDRIKYWMHPELDPRGDGFQVLQSLYAIASGGFMGRGIGNSRQKYLWLPEPQNDFIFSIVCEELGLIGALVIVTLFALLVWRGFVIAMRAPDKFGSLLAIGLTFQVGLQTALNILVVTNAIPNTGISLPFFSYGGTSLMMLLAQMGVIMSISRSSTVEKT